MGGIICSIPRNALLPGDGIPKRPSELIEFDQRMRLCFAQPQIVQGIADAGKGDAACALLRKTQWTGADRVALYDMLDALYED